MVMSSLEGASPASPDWVAGWAAGAQAAAKILAAVMALPRRKSRRLMREKFILGSSCEKMG
jgi:hypothetical protein